ncbi:MAG TPA: hypothetical protein VIY49_13965 [Bryobacteraceae bacterium]
MLEAEQKSRFVVCIWTDGEDDLEPRKVYQVLPDRAAARDDYLRVIDESGEDYLYPAELFVPLKLPAATTRLLERSSRIRVSGPSGRRPVKRP